VSLLTRVERLEGVIGAMSCSCPRINGHRLAVVVDDESGAKRDAVEQVFRQCRSPHAPEDNYLVIRVKNFTQVCATAPTETGHDSSGKAAGDLKWRLADLG